ncbi:MAG: hypothetical protein II723_03040, partial [Oscillospiraceae bacterium]|nr:hypothetical protein [Oscillospiraceae bacterium]
FILLKGSSGEAYNIADSASVFTIKQLAEMLADIGKCKVVVEVPSDIEKRGYNPVSKSVFSAKRRSLLPPEPLQGSVLTVSFPSPPFTPLHRTRTG